jgi:dipeptidyl aminopeptidase/acylaminoacyl peptidase
VPSSPSSRPRLIAFGVLLAVCVVGAAVAIIAGARSSGSSAEVSAGAGTALTDARAKDEPVVVFRRLDHRGQVAIAPLSDPSAAPKLTSLSCDRVAFDGGRGICLTRSNGFAAGYRAALFDAKLHVSHSVPVEGIPSRARVSPDGRFGAVTLFVAGHAYAEPGTFSTQTSLIDMADGRKIADLEKFTTFDGDHQVTAVDVNYWGVTFADDGDTFYATLATGGQTHLIRGSIRARTARTLHTNVECPSLSPDGTRIAYKKRTGSSSTPWRLTVLDLKTMRETPLAETRSVDDQVMWLDDRQVLYGVDGAVWRTAADGSGRPERYLAHGDSPAVVRWSGAAASGT